MQAVDVLGDDCLQLALCLPLRQLAVGGIGLCVRRQHFGPVEVVKLRLMGLIKAVAQHGFRRIPELLMIQAVHTAEIRNAAFRGHARAAEKHDIVAAVHQFLQFADCFFHGAFLPFIR